MVIPSAQVSALVPPNYRPLARELVMEQMEHMIATNTADAVRMLEMVQAARKHAEGTLVGGAWWCMHATVCWAAAHGYVPG